MKNHAISSNLLTFLLITALVFLISSCGTDSEEDIFQLSVNVEPSDIAGSVSSESGTSTAKSGEMLLVKAIPNENWEFHSWTGDISGANQASLNVYMDRDRSITARFVKIEHPVIIETVGNGLVERTIASAKDTTEFQQGTVLQFRAIADDGWSLSEWILEPDIEVEVIDETAIQLSVDQPIKIIAVFERINFMLNVEISGQGEVKENVILPKGSAFPFETIVELTAEPDEDWFFYRWSGDIPTESNSVESSIRVIIDKEKTVRASFITTPTISSTDVTETTENTATIYVSITSDGNSTISRAGVCYDTKSEADENSPCIEFENPGTGNFEVILSELESGQTYYASAYAENAAGMRVGEQIAFTTESTLTVPEVTTSSVGSITTDSALGGGEVTEDGGGTVSQRGLCWNNSPNPSLESNINCSNQGGGLGAFVTTMSGLAAENSYWVRAYATNEAGTTYGNEVSFTTQKVSGDDKGSGGDESDDSSGGGSDDSGSGGDESDDSSGGGSDDSGSGGDESDDAGTGSGSTQVLLMFSTYNQGYSFENPVDVKINNTWYSFNGKTASDPVWNTTLGNGRGIVLNLNTTLNYLEFNPDQIRVEGLNAFGFGFWHFKIFRKDANSDLFNQQIGGGGINQWDHNDGAGRLVGRCGYNQTLDPNPEFFKFNVPASYNNSGKIMIIITGYGQNNPNFSGSGCE